MVINLLTAVFRLRLARSRGRAGPSLPPAGQAHERVNRSPLAHHPATRVRCPDLRQVDRRLHTGERAVADLVGIDVSLGDRLNLKRFAIITAPQPATPPCCWRSLRDHLIADQRPLPKSLQRGPRRSLTSHLPKFGGRRCQSLVPFAAPVRHMCEPRATRQLRIVALSEVAELERDNANIARVSRNDTFEPITLSSALSSRTRDIGLIATATTTYHQPYHLARMLASLDHLSLGRAAWNIVTSGNKCEPPNFGEEEFPDHNTRYTRAKEFVEVVKGLWDTREDALLFATSKLAFLLTRRSCICSTTEGTTYQSEAR